MKYLWYVFLGPLLLIFLVPLQGLALDSTVFAVGEAQSTSTPIKLEGKNPLSISMAKELGKHLAFYTNKFSFVQNEEKALFVITVDHREKPFSYTLLLEDRTKKISQHNKLWSFFEKEMVSQKMASALYQWIFKREDIFSSKIFAVCKVGERRMGSRKVPIKEVFMMDYDGGNKKRLTFHGGIAISPGVSSDRTKVVYSLIKEQRDKGVLVRNVNLLLLDLKTGKFDVISNRPGLNSGAVFMPNGTEIALTLSHEGNAEIYAMNLTTKKLRRLTSHFAPDVDPSFNRDGSLMTFLSGRPGRAMIYVLDPRGERPEKGLRRISYVGKYNATPRFSPDGEHIVFSSWLDNRFDLFRINADGHGLVRLTRNFGSNESASFSPDGEFLVFSSQKIISSKEAVERLFISTKDGEILSSITDEFNHCISPRWSN